MSILDTLPHKSTEVYEVDGVELHLCEMSLSQSRLWSEFYKQNKDNHEKLYAYLLKMCCAEFKDVDQEDIENKLSPKVLLDLGNKIIEMCGLGESSEKKDSATQSDSSLD